MHLAQHTAPPGHPHQALEVLSDGDNLEERREPTAATDCGEGQELLGTKI